MLRRSKTSWSVTSQDFVRTGAPGAICDLSETLPSGGTLADIVNPSWFEPVEPEPVAESAPVRRGRPKQETPDAPVKE